MRKLSLLEQGSRTPRPVRNRAAQQEVSGGASEQSFICRSPLLPIAPHRSHYRLNHHSTPLAPPPSMEKLSSMKLVPGAKKVGDRCPRGSVTGSNPYTSSERQRENKNPRLYTPKPIACILISIILVVRLKDRFQNIGVNLSYLDMSKRTVDACASGH